MVVLDLKDYNTCDVQFMLCNIVYNASGINNNFLYSVICSLNSYLALWHFNVFISDSNAVFPST